MTENEIEERNEFIKGVRLLAAYVEQHEDLPTPNFDWRGPSVSCYVPKEEYTKTESGWHWINRFEEAARAELGDVTKYAAYNRTRTEQLPELVELVEQSVKERAEELHREAQIKRFNEVTRAMLHSVEVYGLRNIALGNFEKKSDDYHITAVRKFSSNVKLTCQLAHESASCEQVVTGTRVVEEPDPEQAKALRDELNAKIAALPKVEVVKEDKKWICPPSLLSVPKEATEATA